MSGAVPHGWCASRERAAARRQSGFSLIETLITVVLAGIVVLGLVAGLLTLVRSRAATDERQRIDLALGNVAESLKAIEYPACDPAAMPDAASYQTAYLASPLSWRPPAGMTAEVVDVEFWDKTSRSFVDTCASGDQGAQQLTIQVTWRGREGSAHVVKGAR